MQYYLSVKDRTDDLRVQIRQVVQTRARYGNRWIHLWRKREGCDIAKNWMYRHYNEQPLQLRSKLPQKVNAGDEDAIPPLNYP